MKVAQSQNDVVGGQSILQEAFRTDVRPLVKESIYRKGGALDALEAYRYFDIRNQLIRERGRTLNQLDSNEKRVLFGF